MFWDGGIADTVAWVQAVIAINRVSSDMKSIIITSSLIYILLLIWFLAHKIDDKVIKTCTHTHTTVPLSCTYRPKTKTPLRNWWYPYASNKKTSLKTFPLAPSTLIKMFQSYLSQNPFQKKCRGNLNFIHCCTNEIPCTFVLKGANGGKKTQGLWSEFKSMWCERNSKKVISQYKGWQCLGMDGCNLSWLKDVQKSS